MHPLELQDAYATVTENGHCKAVKTEDNDHLTVDCQNLLPFIEVGDRVVVTRLCTGQVKVIGVNSDHANYLSALKAGDTLTFFTPILMQSAFSRKIQFLNIDSISLCDGSVAINNEVHYEIV